MCILNHPDKKNVLSDALSWLLTSSFAQIKEEKKDLVCDVHRLARLGVQLVVSAKGGVMVHSESELSLVVFMIPKKGLELIFVRVKRSGDDESCSGFLPRWRSYPYILRSVMCSKC